MGVPNEYWTRSSANRNYEVRYCELQSSDKQDGGVDKPSVAERGSKPCSDFFEKETSL